MTGPDPGVEGRRGLFPRGLRQPASGYRFSVDALLLACFARTRPGMRFLDLGTGCGVVGLALLLGKEGRGLSGLGVDRSPDMTGAARDNITALGLEDRFRIETGEAAGLAARGEIPTGAFDLVVANPPYHQKGRGRNCTRDVLTAARFEDGCGLDGFLAPAAHGLKNRGRACLVFVAERLADLMAKLRSHRLEPKRLRCVHGRDGRPARLVLVEAVKGGGPGLEVEPPLILYRAGSGCRDHTEEALAFCPFLGCGREKK